MHTAFWMCAVGVVCALFGYLLGRSAGRSARPKNTNTCVGCNHAWSYHTKEEYIPGCKHTVGLFGDSICACMKYDGPEPIDLKDFV